MAEYQSVQSVATHNNTQGANTQTWRTPDELQNRLDSFLPERILHLCQYALQVLEMFQY